MTRLRRSTGTALALSALAATALAGASAPAALAADDCPNAAVRAQQQSQHLPNCMAYEKISPADKNGSPPRMLASTPDGSNVMYHANTAVDGGAGLMVGQYRMRRPTDGSTDWTLTDLSPPMVRRLPILVDMPSVPAWSTDLDRTLMLTRYPIAGNDQGTTTGRGVFGSEDFYIREPDGSFSWVVPDPSAVDTSTLPVKFVGASSDLDRVAVSTARQFDPRVTTDNVEHVYVWSRSGMQLASVLPDGSLPASVYNHPDPAVVTKGVSADGRRVAFMTGEWAPEKLYVRFDADDPATARTREVAVGPNGETCLDVSFQKLSGDGTKVLFTCQNAIIAGAPEAATYVRDLDGGLDAVSVIGALGGGPSVLAATDDFSRIYITGGGQLHLSRDSGPAERVVTTTQVFGSPFNNAFASPDGEYLAFEASYDFGLPGVDAGSSTDTQVYRFSARSGELACVSCRRDGSPTNSSAAFRTNVEWVAPGMAPVDPVSDGGTVTFTSDLDLDPGDSNGKYDAYAWIDGRQVLLSSGRSEAPSVATGLSADGRSIFFTTADPLVPNDHDRAAYDIYAARIDGGVLIPDAPAPCTANCKAPAPERPSLPGIGSTDVLGRGNLVEDTTNTKQPARASASLTASRSVRGTSTKVRVKVSRAGSIRVSGAGLRQATVKAKKAGSYRVTVRLSANGVKQQRSRGRVKTRVTARFTPESGASVSARKSVTFTAKKGGR